VREGKIGVEAQLEHGWIAEDSAVMDPTLPKEEVVGFPGLEFPGRACLDRGSGNYQAIQDWFDVSKALLPTFRHRPVGRSCHHAESIVLCLGSSARR
jgi:hypothetical protein